MRKKYIKFKTNSKKMRARIDLAEQIMSLLNQKKSITICTCIDNCEGSFEEITSVIEYLHQAGYIKKK